MKTNKIKKIQVPQSGFKASRFNWSHDVNTTYGWGEVQPTQVKLIQSDSNTFLNTQELIRLAPMPSPTFGRIKFKTYHQFVPISEIFTNYDRLMAQEPVSTAFGTKVPQELPSIVLGRLCSYCVHGSRATISYAAGNTESERWSNYLAGKFEVEYRANENITPSSVYYDALFNSGVLTPYANAYVNLDSALDTGTRLCIIPSLMGDSSVKACYVNSDPNLDWDNPNKPSVIPLAAKSLADVFPVRRSVAYTADGAPVVGPAKREVTFDGADYLIEFEVTYNSEKYYYCLALEFSDFGKRIRKILQGCGYQIDLSANYKVSLLPLFAQYKAYFEVFGLTLYQGWETTFCAKVLDSIDQAFVDCISRNKPAVGYNPLIQDLPNLFNDYGFVNGNAFIRFMLDEVGNEWYTEEPDWIGSHTNKIAVSPQGVTSSDRQFISVDSAGLSGPHLGGVGVLADDMTYSQFEGSLYSVESGANENAVMDFINNLQHSQIDADLLKRMYRWTNRNTILGRSVEKLLRAQGLGDYVDKCESYYIGATDNMITISDVISQSATNDAVLGEYGGRGLQYIENHKLQYYNKSTGYWITLACVVPVSGYTQGLDPTVTALRKFELYNSDFDAVGYMLTPKSTVCAARFVSSIGIDSKEGLKGFGFTPMYSNFKVCQNLTNGDFNRHNQRNKYLSYTLDKQLSYNDYDVTKENYNDISGVNTVQLKRTNTLDALAVAGNVWRTPTKYPWLGNFSRIFYNMGEVGDIDAQVNNLNGYLLGWDTYNSDNFLAHSIYDLQCEARMKPIEESYGLGEDANPTSGVSYTSKA